MNNIAVGGLVTRIGERRLPWLAMGLAHVVTVLWLLGGACIHGRLLYFRDLSTYYAPDYAVMAESLRAGVWPLWNPRVNAGQPFLLVYPVDVLLLAIGGWQAPLGWGAALHLLIALLGASWLGRRLGLGPWGSWIAGVAYGLGGFLVSTVNLVPLFQAEAWAPWVLGAWVGLVRDPTGRRIGLLAALAALQASTLGAEVVLLTAAAGVVLVGLRPLGDRRLLLRLAIGGVVALALAGPAILGTRALLEGTARGQGFRARDAMAFSLHPVVLAEAVLPNLLGDPRSFSDAAYWGRAYFPDGYPYLLTLYVGVGVLLLATRAGARRGLVVLALAGVVLSLGAYGPLALVPEGWTLPFRGPQKMFFLTHLALALLAGSGLERAASRRSAGGRAWWLPAPGLLVLALVAAARLDPEALQRALGTIAPPLVGSSGFVAASAVWPVAWLPTGGLAVAAGLALARGGSWARAAAVMAALDLVIANGGVNDLAPPKYYELRPDVAGVVRPAAAEGDYRWFSYGVAHTPGLRFEPTMARVRSDVWLYYLDRQTLLAHAPALDGLDAAFDLDRTGWAPPGAALAVGEADPARFARIHRRLRLANVRWVLSFAPLPGSLVTRHAEVKLPEVVPPLGLYELREPLPRAFWVAGAVVEPDPRRRQALLEDPSFDPAAMALVSLLPEPPAADREEEPARPTVVYRRIDAHTVRVSARTPPGLIVVLDGYHADWTAEERSRPVPLLRADGRYRAIPTPGGEHVFTMRYRPRWRTPALLLAAGGLLGLVALWKH